MKKIKENMGKRCHVKIIEDKYSRKAKYEVNIKGKKKEIFPEEVSSEILKEIKKIAEQYNKNIKKAVITVPAHFKKKEREAIIEAARMAGLEVIQLIDEPTAAAIAYGEQIKSKSNKERTILIFDIGGGNFGFSIVKIKGNEYFVLGSDGEDNLGQENFTQRLMDYFIQEIKLKYPNETLDQNNKDEKSLKLFSLIKYKTEEVKNKLLGDRNALFKIEEGQIRFQMEININKYIELCGDLWKKCIEKVKNYIPSEYKENIKGYINDIILIGGAAKTPTIKERIKEFLGKPGLENINGDEVVAYGAAVAGNFIKNLKDLII